MDKGSVMPDPDLASKEDLSEWLPKLLDQNPNEQEEEDWFLMARWHYAKSQQKKSALRFSLHGNFSAVSGVRPRQT